MTTTQALPENLLRRPVHPDVTESMIEEVVRSFYAKVRVHHTLGPLFDPVIGEDWEPHLSKMCEFWSSVMLMSGRYKGKPMAAHVRLKNVRSGDFDDWLDLFRETVEQVCPPAIANIFMDRAEKIADGLMTGMFNRSDDSSSNSRYRYLSKPRGETSSLDHPTKREGGEPWMSSSLSR